MWKGVKNMTDEDLNMDERRYEEIKNNPKKYISQANKVFEPNGYILKDRDADRKHKLYFLLTFIALVGVIGYSSYNGYYKSDIAFNPNMTAICEGTSYNFSCPPCPESSYNITCGDCNFPDKISIETQ